MLYRMFTSIHLSHVCLKTNKKNWQLIILQALTQKVKRIYTENFIAFFFFFLVDQDLLLGFLTTENSMKAF